MDKYLRNFAFVCIGWASAKAIDAIEPNNGWLWIVIICVIYAITIWKRWDWY